MPSITARQICTPALRLLGVAAAEQPITPDMAEAALDGLNSMLGSWATERVLTYTRPTIVLVLVPGQAVYTWGEVSATLLSPDIAQAPPVRLELAVVRIPGSPAQDWPVRIVDQAAYETGVAFKALPSAYPAAVYLEMSQPYANLHVYPVPTMAYTLRLSPWQAREPYDTWDSALSWPDGYERAMTYNLAVDLAPQYQSEPSPTVLRIAEQSKAMLGNVNAKVGRLTSDYDTLRQSDIPVANIPAFLTWGS